MLLKSLHAASKCSCEVCQGHHLLSLATGSEHICDRVFDSLVQFVTTINCRYFVHGFAVFKSVLICLLGAVFG